ncbi:MAG: hypothetical protein M8354_13160, partial [Halalkalicoccus sp.]|nr:hypothetical protein [Halalkalicoccus sp.]
FLGMELSIIPTWALVAFRLTDRDGFEAALKYFLMSIFAAALLLYGFSLVYGAVGSVTIPFPNEVETSRLLLAGIALVLAGFAFELAAFPFHQWLPDVFDAAYAEVPAGEYRLCIYPAGEREEAVLGADVEAMGGTVASAFATGYVTPEDAPADEEFDIVLTADSE